MQNIEQDIAHNLNHQMPYTCVSSYINEIRESLKNSLERRNNAGAMNKCLNESGLTLEYFDSERKLIADTKNKTKLNR